MTEVKVSGSYSYFLAGYTDINFNATQLKFSQYWSTGPDDFPSSGGTTIKYIGNFSNNNGVYSGEITGIITDSWADGPGGDDEWHGEMKFSDSVYVEDLAAFQKSGTTGIQLLLSGDNDLYGIYSGYNGDDTFHAAYTQKIEGGSGFDKVIWDRQATAVDFDMSTDLGNFKSVEMFVATRYADTMRGNSGNNFLDGAFGDDLIYGNADNDNLKGDRGNDSLVGGTGADKLYGGDGNDKIYGGSGADILNGGKGDDIFIFKSYQDSFSSKADHIQSFNRADDLIDLKAMDANSEKSGNQTFDWIGKSSFHGTAGELRYFQSGNHTVIVGDLDGDKKVDFRVYIDDKLTISALDFHL